MWIILAGDPFDGGFAVRGPFKTLEDADRDLTDGGQDQWSMPLEPTECYDPKGTAVVFGGDIGEAPWRFFGPFRDVEAAREWAAAHGIGRNCAIKMMEPVGAEAPAA